jgi:hypothetical protein
VDVKGLRLPAFWPGFGVNLFEEAVWASRRTQFSATFADAVSKAMSEVSAIYRKERSALRSFSVKLFGQYALFGHCFLTIM